MTCAGRAVLDVLPGLDRHAVAILIYIGGGGDGHGGAAGVTEPVRDGVDDVAVGTGRRPGVALATAEQDEHLQVDECRPARVVARPVQRLLHEQVRDLIAGLRAEDGDGMARRGVGTGNQHGAAHAGRVPEPAADASDSVWTPCGGHGFVGRCGRGDRTAGADRGRRAEVGEGDRGRIDGTVLAIGELPAHGHRGFRIERVQGVIENLAPGVRPERLLQLLEPYRIHSLVPAAFTEDATDDRAGEHEIRRGVGLWGHFQQRVLLGAFWCGGRGAQHSPCRIDAADEAVEARAQFGPLRAGARQCVELGLRVLTGVSGRPQLLDILVDAGWSEELAEPAGAQVPNDVHCEHSALCTGPTGAVGGVLIRRAVDERHAVFIPLDRDPGLGPFLPDDGARGRVERGILVVLLGRRICDLAWRDHVEPVVHVALAGSARCGQRLTRREHVAYDQDRAAGLVRAGPRSRGP